MNVENNNQEQGAEKVTKDDASQEATQDTSETADNETSGLEQENKRLQAEVKEHQNKYLYLYADFETYKKRAFKERSDLVKFGNEPLLKELLQVADNLDRALQYTDSAGSASESNSLITGLQMVHKQLHEVLVKFGVSQIETMGNKFNPEIHEAVSKQEVSTKDKDLEDGQVLQEYQKGYLLHGRLLRPARVSVAVRSA